jgi:hypothetical protein
MSYKNIIRDLADLDESKLKEEKIKRFSLISEDDFPPRLVVYKEDDTEEYIDTESEIEKYLKRFF